VGGRKAVLVKRIYESPDSADGARILVDRVWPRGVSKDRAGLDEWCREVAPTTALRKWYRHDPEKFPEFRRRYLRELDDEDHAEAVRHLRGLARKGRLTLLTATREVDISAATVLAGVLR
jgi:uncharacterized protein YeaO (DUF488 family)